MTPGAARPARRRTKNRPFPSRCPFLARCPFLFVPLTVEEHRGMGRVTSPSYHPPPRTLFRASYLARILTVEMDGPGNRQKRESMRNTGLSGVRLGHASGTKGHRLMLEVSARRRLVSRARSYQSSQKAVLSPKGLRDGIPELDRVLCTKMLLLLQIPKMPKTPPMHLSYNHSSSTNPGKTSI